MQLGALVVLLLAVLTGVEYVIAVEMQENILPLVFIALVKAALILWYFMHIARSWAGREH